MTKTEYLEKIAGKVGVDVSQIPDNLITTYLAAILAALESGGGSSGGSSGGGGAKLYRHDITVENWWNDCSIVQFTLYNADPTNYSAQSKYDENSDDPTQPIEHADMTALLSNFPLIPGKKYSADIPAVGFADPHMNGYLTDPIFKVCAFDSALLASYYWYDEDMELYQESTVEITETVTDTVTKIF